MRVRDRRIETAEWPGDDHLAPVVLLHEGLGSVGRWRGFPAALQAATGRRVIAYSRFGHGRSDPPAVPRTPAFFHALARDVLPSVFAQTGVREPLLVGHSDGASIALIHAGAHPTTGVVAMAPHVFVEEMTIAAIEQVRRQYLDGDLRARMSHRHADVDPACWSWCNLWLDPAFRSWTLDDHAQRLDCPMLLIQGVEDQHGTLAQLDRIESLARGPVDRLHVPGGHNPQFDAPQPTHDAIARFADGRP